MAGEIDIIVPQATWPTFDAFNSALARRGFPVQLSGFSAGDRPVSEVAMADGSGDASARVRYLDEDFEQAVHFNRVAADDVRMFSELLSTLTPQRIMPAEGDYWITTSDPDVWQQDNAGLYVAAAMVADFGGYVVGDVDGVNEEAAATILDRLYLDELEPHAGS